MTNRIHLLWGIVLLIFLFSISLMAQQGINLPRASQHATVSQKIGIAEITIDYHRPGVKERGIWGALVPYDQVWRAGANENTTITFSHPVKIDGKNVPAGIYGLHMIPTEKEWTIILNKDFRAWGSFFYVEENDLIRFTVTPETDDHQEWLMYSFSDVSPNSTTVQLNWEKLQIPFTIEVDLYKMIIEDIKIQLTSLPGFFWQGWNQAANYCYQNGIMLEQGIEWADRSIQINKNVTNTFTKAVILDELGKSNEANQLKEEAFVDAIENDINTLGYQFLFAGKMDEAIEIFKKNVEMNPDSWNVYDSLGEGYMNKGDSELAIKYFSKALEIAPENQHERIKGTLTQLKTK
jgi:tetratricopeptide (TPR) repeat protein